MSSLPSLNLPSLPGAEVPAGIRASLSAQAGQRGVAYSDVRGLQHIEGDESGIRAAAQQFESLFIGMMLKGMRDANAVFAEGNPLSSQEMTMHQEMLDQQWAIHMAESGGMGLAPVIEAQLRGERVPMPDASGVGSGSLAGPRPDVGPSAAPAAGAAENVALVSRPGGQKAPGYASREAFVSDVLPRLERVLAGSAVEPLHVLAQSALETGWGQHVIHHPDGASSHNLFGIKAGAGWQGDSVEVKTLEFVDGRAEVQSAHFRSYSDVESAARDYLRLLESNPRYQRVLEAPDGDAFADALQQSGYATDPAYARKVRAVIGSVAGRTGA